MSEQRQVYEAIAKVMADLSKEGIGKDRKNTGQGYSFRGVDDVYNALAPILSRHGLVMLPRVLARTCDVRQSKNGGDIYYVCVDAEFDLVAAADGSSHTIRTFGEAMDSADKATNKAMSAAYKYAAFQAFCIPTEGDNDADAHTHHPAPTNGKKIEDGEPWVRSLIGNHYPDFVKHCERHGFDPIQTAKDARGAQVRDGDGLSQYVEDRAKREAVPA